MFVLISLHVLSNSNREVSDLPEIGRILDVRGIIVHMSSSSDPIEIVNSLFKIDWGLKKSALAGIIYSCFLVGAAAGFLSTIGVELAPRYYVTAVTALAVLSLSFAYYHRVIKSSDNSAISVGFAVKTSRETDIFYDELKASFRREIEAAGLRKYFKFIEVPRDIILNSGESAEKYLTKRGIGVVVWGDTVTGTKDAYKQSVFNLQVSYQYRANGENMRKEITHTLNEGNSRGDWAIRHDDSLEGVAIVAGNVTEISIFTLGVCLLSVGEVEYVKRGVVFLEALRVKLKNRSQNANFPNLNSVNEKIKQQLFWAYMALTKYYLNDKKSPDDALVWIKKADAIKQGDYTVDIIYARVAWELGDAQTAFSKTVSAKNINPRNILHNLNFAFFNLYNGKYLKGLNQYKRLSQHLADETNIVDVVEFILRQYDATGKTALKFAAGWLSIKFADEILGHQLLLEYIEESNDSLGEGCLADEAKRITMD